MLKHLRDHAEHHTGVYIWLVTFIGIAAELGIAVGQVRFG